MKSLSFRFLQIVKRPRLSNWQIQITLPQRLRVGFLQHPKIARLGFKCDSRGRIRKSMGRLTLPEVKAIARVWEGILDVLEAEHLTTALREAVALAARDVVPKGKAKGRKRRR